MGLHGKNLQKLIFFFSYIFKWFSKKRLSVNQALVGLLPLLLVLTFFPERLTYLSILIQSNQPSLKSENTKDLDINVFSNEILDILHQKHNISTRLVGVSGVFSYYILYFSG